MVEYAVKKLEDKIVISRCNISEQPHLIVLLGDHKQKKSKVCNNSK
jgi:hypothetical protein